MLKSVQSLMAVLTLLNASLLAQNLITNGAFEGNNTIWRLNLLETASETSATLDFPSLSINGSTCARIKVIEKQPEDWYIQLAIPSWQVKANSIYRFSFYAKGESSIQISAAYGKDAPEPYKYKEGFTFNLRQNWAKYSGEFSSDIEGNGLLELTINVGDHPGEYLLDSLVLEEIDKIDQWNTWYSQADARIDQFRKNSISFNSLIDDKGKNVTAGTVTLKQNKHAFPFGTSLILADTVSASDNKWYQAKAKELFNSITIESAFKWVDFEPMPNQLKSSEIAKYTTYADTNGMKLRGHVLAWALQKYGFETHWPQIGTDQQLKAAIKNRILRDVAAYKGKIHEHDVWNEPFHEPEWFNRLNHLNQNRENYWELMDSAFHWARSADSSADLYLNEYSVVAGGQTETLREIVRGMIDRKVPITGIGAQCHFGNNPIEPELIRKRLDSLASLGLKIKLTEFDMGSPEEGVLLTEKQMASEYAKFLRTAFSHPAVDGITIWGFWDKLIWNKPVYSETAQQWSQGAGLFKSDKSPKLAADSVVTLLTKTWRTDTSFNLASKHEIRGFYGTYDIEIKNGDTLWMGTFSLKADVPTDTIRVKRITPVKIATIEKSAQRFFARTDSKSRIVRIRGAQAVYPTTLELLDLRGRRIYQSTIENADSFEFDLSTVPDGIFVMKLFNGTAAIQQKLLLTR